MENAEVIKVLSDIVKMLELKGENKFKIRAYQKAAEELSHSSEDVQKLVREGNLRKIPGVGEAIEKKITELVDRKSVV